MLGSGTKKRSDSSVDRWEDLSAELWEVQAAPGLTKLMTLDELDAAFKADDVSTNTIVRRPGTVQWKTLAEIAGIEPSAEMLESESLVPVASDVELPKIPKAPPLPREARRDSRPLTTGELSVVRPRRLGRTLASFAVVAVVGACVFFGVNGLVTRLKLNPPQLAAAAFVVPEPDLPAPEAKVPASTAPVPEPSATIELAKDGGKDAKAPPAKPAPKAAAPSKAFAARAPGAVAAPHAQVQVKAGARTPATLKKAAPRHL
jgi:hypothetical protein